MIVNETPNSSGSRADFAAWFEEVTGHPPYPWQRRLANDGHLRNRLIRIPTGFGKTLGGIAAWWWHRIERADDLWPRRLVWTLPMRTLVEQTAAVAEQFRDRTGRDVGVHVLMGGRPPGRDWALAPEQPAILVGTQDMLLSRALNRGFAAGRARWPHELGLLWQDALWIFDEVQLMDAGLATAVQLQAFRDRETSATASPRPTRSWWMSATLQPDWLRTADAHDLADAPLEPHARTELSPDEQRSGPGRARKPLEVKVVPREDDAAGLHRIAELALRAHAELVASSRRLTLVVVNRVGDAQEIYRRLVRECASTTRVALAHSRFRRHERTAWAESFLSRTATGDGTDTIVVATQVVEAGVDLSADVLLTEAAPWPSLVQRFGRVARDGGSGRVIVIDREHDSDSSAPYDHGEIGEAVAFARTLDDVGPASIEAAEAGLDADRLALLYPYEPAFVLTAREMAELFDTSPDLSGGDIDVARYIRSGVDRDLLVAWWEGTREEGPRPDEHPGRDWLCPVPIAQVRSWLKKRRSLDAWPPSAWAWDHIEGQWRGLRAGDLRPGVVILVHDTVGGYDSRLGFTGEKPKGGEPDLETESLALPEEDAADSAAEAPAEWSFASDASSDAGWRTIATHGREVAEEAVRIATALGLPASTIRVLDLAGRFHDLGKVHPAFAASILRDADAPGDLDLAKAPRWCSPRDHGRLDRASGPRPGIRHELASMLGVLEMARVAAPLHPDLTGGVAELLEACGAGLGTQDDTIEMAEPLTRALASLGPGQLDLLLYLVAAHHGKVRTTLQAGPHDGRFPWDAPQYGGRGLPILGVREGDVLPPARIDLDGSVVTTPAVELNLEPAAIGLSHRYGPSWQERAARLRDRHGIGGLALLEAILRTADARASGISDPDPLLASVEAGP